MGSQGRKELSRRACLGLPPGRPITVPAKRTSWFDYVAARLRSLPTPPPIPERIFDHLQHVSLLEGEGEDARLTIAFKQKPGNSSISLTQEMAPYPSVLYARSEDDLNDPSKCKKRPGSLQGTKDDSLFAVLFGDDAVGFHQAFVAHNRAHQARRDEINRLFHAAVTPRRR